MRVLALEQEVELGSIGGSTWKPLVGTISTISISSAAVRYEVIYWHEGLRHEVWVDAYELTRSSKGLKRETISFTGEHHENGEQRNEAGSSQAR